MKIHIDGHLYDEPDAKISVFDHGLLYGDGVFEGIRFYNGRIFRFDQHLDRLFDSAKAILLKMPCTREQIIEAHLETIRANDLRDGYLRTIVTRGKGSLGLSPDTCPRPSLIIIAAGISLYPAHLYETGLDVVTCSTRRTSPAALTPAVKSLNYLSNIMAKIEADIAGCKEGIMLNEQGYVAECTGDNIFMIKRGVLYTPPVEAGSLRGITREVVQEIAAELGIPLVERDLIRYDLYTADEAFLTGTAAEAIPMVRLDRREIGDATPGPLTRRIIARFRERTQAEGYPIYQD